MYSSYSAAAFALRAAKPAYNAHSPYAPSHHCSQQHYDGDGAHRELLPVNPHLSPRFLLDGYLLRHSTHLLLLSARLRPPPPPPPRPPHSCCHRRAPARCCCSGGGGGRSYAQHVTWGLEGRGHRCCGQGAGRSDLGVGCRRLKARGCGCGSYGSGRLGLGTGCGHRDTPRLLGRAVRQEVWKYEGGQWPHRSCSTECHSDWDDEEDEDQCGHAQWELPVKSSFRRKWKEEEEEDDRCRDCRRRKGVENEYYDEGEYSGRRKENRDVNGAHDRHRYHRRRLEQRGYIDDEDTRRRSDVMEGRDRREFKSDEARDVGVRRYSEDDRKYDRRRERRDSEYEDVLDARRVGAGRYNEDDRRSDRRTGRMDFEIDSEDDVRRDGRCLRNDDERVVIRNTRRNEYMEEDDQDMAERKHYSRGRSQSSTSAFHEDDSQRASSSRNTVDTRVARGNSSSRVRWDDNVDRRAAQTSEEREGRYSSLVGLSNDEKDEYNYDDARIVRVRDSRTGTQDIKVITEDDTRLNSSSKNSSILKHHRDVDRQVAARKDETKKSSLKVVESSSEVRGNNTELDSTTQSNQLEDRRNYIDNKSSPLQSSIKMASDSRRQIDQHDVVDQQVVALTDSRTNTEKLTDIKMDSSQHVSRASHSQRNYEEVNQMDIDDTSTSVENITHITRDKRRYVNQQVIHETDIDVQNVTHVDVSTIHASDISASSRSQNHSETRSDVNSISNISLIDRARGQQEQIHQNKVIAGDNTIVRGSQSHHDTGVYGQVHLASVIDSTKEMQEQVELSKARTNNAATTSTSESHIQTRIYDRFQPSSSVNTVRAQSHKYPPPPHQSLSTPPKFQESSSLSPTHAKLGPWRQPEDALPISCSPSSYPPSSPPPRPRATRSTPARAPGDSSVAYRGSAAAAASRVASEVPEAWAPGSLAGGAPAALGQGAGLRGAGWCSRRWSAPSRVPATSNGSHARPSASARTATMGKTAGEVVAAVDAASTAPAAARRTAKCWSNQPAYVLRRRRRRTGDGTLHTHIHIQDETAMN